MIILPTKYETMYCSSCHEVTTHHDCPFCYDWICCKCDNPFIDKNKDYHGQVIKMEEGTATHA